MKYQYWFANRTEFSARAKRSLLENCQSAEEIYHLSNQQLESMKDLTTEDRDIIRLAIKKANLDEDYGKFLETGVNFITIENDNFPEKLRDIPNPPYSLFFLGHLPSKEGTKVAIVGARGRSSYGNEVARKLSFELGKQGIEVISGMALGIDSDAHTGTLEAKGETYAVLGCGVDICYPTQNKSLYRKIINQGGVISEAPLGTQPLPMLFPIRNRIIAGLADKVVVIEARKKSGSLITADLAMEQGRDVYAIPGRITDSLSQGCNQLIYQGAFVLNDLDAFVKDILQLDGAKNIQMDFKKNLLEKEERLVYSLLDFCPKGLGSLMEYSGLPLSQLLCILESLNRKGFARETTPNYFIRTL